MKHLNKVRATLGYMLHQWHKRVGEFIIAGLTIINARAVLIEGPHGSSLAPFLASALDFLARKPLLWALLLGLIGIIHMAIILTSFGREWLGVRAMACMVQSLVYVGITIAIYTGPAPVEAGERYFFVAWCAFWVAVALGAEAIGKHRRIKRGGERG